jgi:ParB family chromosome partitioning protein
MSKKTFKIKNDLLEALDDTIASAQNYAGELYVQMIPIRKIEIDPDNPRELQLDISDVINTSLDNINENSIIIAEKESLFSIAQSIAEQGVINPILVYKEADHYKLIAGQRRTLASIIAGKQDIPAKILDKKPNPLQISQLQWIENIEREDLTLLERINNINKIIFAYKTINNNEEVTPSKLAKLLSCSLQQAVNYNHILNASEEVQQLIKNNQIKSIDKAATICKSDPDTQIALIDSHLDGASLKELKRIAHSELKSLESSENIKAKPKHYTLGKTTNINILKFIIQAITNQLELTELSDKTPYINLNEHNTVLEGYKELMTLLEKNIQSINITSLHSD